ncbi:gem-associated protein 8 isoform X1 [Dermacentor silvarum]|uniref:gem-associated protein 8 isoform X1 n=1 Tax=Dermacentor silvarum TaxID=543639 RepID=UPI002100FD49|nr:gem-associated protein 8 isoform X1 [Dermacentor silvarum]
MRPYASLNTESESCMRGRWYQNPLFKRYWHHYHNTLIWFQHHQQLLRDVAAQSAASSDCDAYIERRPLQTCQELCAYETTTKYSLRKQRLQVPATRTVQVSQAGQDYRFETPEDGDFEMPVTEELIAFFEQSARHRKSLGNSGVEQELQWGQTVASASCRHHVQLYGPAAAAAVRGMETAMQLSFEHFTDSQQPKPWPNIPLKL